ncbi:hypothetical protein AB0L82_12200 [Nocardia sp. NPDC052001]
MAEIFSGQHYRRDVILAARAIVNADELGMPVEEVQQVLQGRREH